MRPWKKRHSTPVVDDRWFRLTADQCELPNGMVLDPFYVVHEKELVHVFAMNSTHQLLVVRQYRYAADTTCLELPGGIVDPGEEPLTAAKRELFEETGYSSEEWEFVGTMLANPARQTNRVHIFFARNISLTGQQQLDPSEEIECSLMPLQAVQNAIESGDFSPAHHIASFYRGLHHANGTGRIDVSTGCRPSPA